jgi:hypothetical protein
MGWYRPHASLNRFQEARIDRCINCGDDKEIKTQITMEFGEGNYNTGSICKDCYGSYQYVFDIM